MDFHEIESITVSNPDDPMGLPIYDGDPEAVTLWLVDGDYPAVAHSAESDEDLSGILTIANGVATFEG